MNWNLNALFENKESFYRAKAMVIEQSDIQKEPDGDDFKLYQDIKLEILEGEFDTNEYSCKYYLLDQTDRTKLKNEDKVFVQITQQSDGNVIIQIEDILEPV